MKAGFRMARSGTAAYRTTSREARATREGPHAPKIRGKKNVGAMRVTVDVLHLSEVRKLIFALGQAVDALRDIENPKTNVMRKRQIARRALIAIKKRVPV